MPVSLLLILRKFFSVVLFAVLAAGCASSVDLDLIAAARNGEPRKIELQLFNGADINMRGKDGRTALFEAAKRGDTRTVYYLIRRGADVNLETTDGLSPLYISAYYGRIDVINLLIKNGADITAASVEGYTPLIIAAERGKTKAVEALLSGGFDINAATGTGRTPLMFASLRGHVDTVEYLLKEGADSGLASLSGETALDHARSGYRSGRRKYKWEFLRAGMSFVEVRDIAGDMLEPDELYSSNRVVIETDSGTYIFRYGKLVEWLKNKYFRGKPADEKKLASYERVINILEETQRAGHGTQGKAQPD